ncbi:chaplin, partial [Streptomyces sp. NPDC052107]|uniref:chaplin n=1 Tax=Streptomyces sp. NPDC052107 TaxID=3155632 RepID=UPI00341EAC35
MRQTLSRGVVVAAAATSVLSLYGSPAIADSNADGTSNGSPGVLSGNTVQVPVNVPINACGNTVNVIALLNPAFGNSCDSPANTGRQTAPVPPSRTGNSDTSSVATPP